MKIRRTLMHAAAVIGTVLAFPASASLAEFDALYVFGASLSDTGNDLAITDGLAPPTTRYDKGRFSNGPVWVEYLATQLALSLKPSVPGFDLTAGDSVNFGFGGSGTGGMNLTPGGFPVPGVVGQVGIYAAALGGQPVNSGALNVVFGGANDYLLGITSNPSEPIGNLRTAIEVLFELGARNFLVPNLPDLGQTPLGISIGNPDALTELTDTHNQLLALTLQDLAIALPGISIFPLYTNDLFLTILNNLDEFGFTSGIVPGPASGCLLPPFDCSPVDFTTSAFFWDEQHPTTAVHELLGQTAVDVLAVPEPTTFALITVGLLVVGRRLRNQGTPWSCFAL